MYLWTFLFLRMWCVTISPRGGIYQWRLYLYLIYIYCYGLVIGIAMIHFGGGWVRHIIEYTWDISKWFAHQSPCYYSLLARTLALENIIEIIKYKLVLILSMLDIFCTPVNATMGVNATLSMATPPVSCNFNFNLDYWYTHNLSLFNYIFIIHIF